MGIRFLIIVLIVWLAYWLIKRYIKNKQFKRPSIKKKSSQKILKCEICATHVPEPEAIVFKGRYYCSEEHKRLDLKN